MCELVILGWRKYLLLDLDLSPVVGCGLFHYAIICGVFLHLTSDRRFRTLSSSA